MAVGGFRQTRTVRQKASVKSLANLIGCKLIVIRIREKSKEELAIFVILGLCHRRVKWCGVTWIVEVLRSCWNLFLYCSI
jgi:hypothetical protein